VTRLSALDITLVYDAKVIQKILDDTYNPEYGARPVRRYIQDSLEDAIAESMLTQKNKKHLTLTVEKKELKFSWK
jgi:ATP-dependent Clp protease ATP-binding subunit ClpA